MPLILLLLIVLYPDLKKVSENFFKKQRDQRSQVSNSKMNSSSEIELAPLRSLDDFILSKSRSHFSSLSILVSDLASRFQVPDYNNVEKLINRIVSNLIYYQTNYALSTVVIFSLITMMNPFKMFLGMSTMVVCKLQNHDINSLGPISVVVSVRPPVLLGGEAGAGEAGQEGAPHPGHAGHLPLRPLSHLPGDCLSL